MLYDFEQKTWYALTHPPNTRIVVFWHISNTPPMSGICYNTPTFCIPAIFVEYCYTTGSSLLYFVSNYTLFGLLTTRVPFHKDYSPSGEQLEIRKLAHEL